MPKDDISNPRKAPILAIDDADDEVIDLLEVVKPGRGLKQDAGGDDRDFGADLDAMLDGLSEAGVEAAAPDIPDQPAPFPDPTPVDHKVDHNETLDLPGMDDLDNLLKSFGAPGADSGTEETEDPDFADVDLSMPDLDALPASPAVSKKAAPGPVAPDFESAAPAAVAAKPAKKAIPAPEEDELLASLLADASAPPAAAKSGKPAPAAGPDDDLLAELGLALGSDAKEDAPSLDNALFDAADAGNAALDLDDLDSDPAGDVPSFVEDADVLGDLELPPLEAGDGAPAGVDLPDLDDLNLDTLGLEAEEPKAKTPPAKAPAGASLEDELDLALAGGGPDDLDIESLMGAGQAPDDHEAAGFAADEAIADDLADLATSALGADPAGTTFPDLDEEAFPEIGEDDPGPEAARLLATATPAEAPAEGKTSGDSVLDEKDGLDLEDRDPDPLKAATPEAPAKAASSPEGPAGDAEGAASRFDEVDLNELDALLDDMLATAPASGPGPAAVIAANGTNGQSAPADAPVGAKPAAPAEAVASAHPALEAVQAQVAGQEEVLKEMQTQLTGHEASLKEQEDTMRVLRQDLDALSAEAGEQRERFAGYDAEIQGLAQRFSEFGDKLQALEPAAETETADETPAQEDAGDPLAEYGAEVQELVQRFSDASDRVRNLEQRLTEQGAEMQDLVQRFSGSCDQIQVMEQRLDGLAAAAPGPSAEAGDDPRLEALAGRVEQLETHLAEQNAKCEALEARVAGLLANMDKLAAETAAKVIREELAALMESMS